MGVTQGHILFETCSLVLVGLRTRPLRLCPLGTIMLFLQVWLFFSCFFALALYSFARPHFFLILLLLFLCLLKSFAFLSFAKTLISLFIGAFLGSMASCFFAH